MNHFNPNEPAIIETDASDFAISAVLSQRNKENKLHPVAYFSKKLSPQELSFGVPVKELYAIMCALTKWRHWLEGAQYETVVYTDHDYLWKFLTNKVFTRQQGGWYIQNSSINYKIYYRPGRTNGKADALSRDPQHRSGNHNTKIDLQNIEFPIRMLPTEYLEPEEKPQLINLSAIQQIQFKDPFKEKCGKSYSKEELSKFRGAIGHTNIYKEDGLFFIDNKLRPPSALYDEIITKEHNTGHWGRDKTIDLINRNFTIPGLHTLVIDKISKCDTCQRNKSLKHKR
jgi:hypothetical protein